ncbi:MAG: cyanophycinase [Candidatus Saliniplasma sp.]
MPKGQVVTIGGNLDFFLEDPIIVEFLNRIREYLEHSPMIGIIPSASLNPIRTGKKYSHLFRCDDIQTKVIYPEDREEANKESTLRDIEDCDAFFFTGGNQLRITALLGGTESLRAIKEKFENGAFIGGTSAGSVCLTRTMIAYGKSKESLLHGKVELSPGLSIIEDAVIDTHFTARGRFPRLVHVVTEHPGILGVGLGEDTAAFWDFEKKEFFVVGSRNIVVVDGKEIGLSNVPHIKYREPICVEGIRVHILGNGWGFDLENKKPYFNEELKVTHPEDW